MPPFGFTPPARGGRAMPLPRGGRAVAPRAPRTPSVSVRVKPIDPNAQAQQNAMSAFRTALAQLQSSTPAVDSNAIYAPYRSSEAVTGQLGQGLQQSLLNSGQAAQSQYSAALDQAQQHAAQFGISAGAGANPTALQNNGAAPLAQQTNAYAAAAPQAATAWQQALERAAGAKVADATLQRQNLIASGSANLSTALPGAIAAEKTRLFQAKAQKFNEGLAMSQLTAKQRADLRKYNLDVTKTKLSADAAATKAGISERSLQERKRHDKATEKGARIRAQRASARGVQGMPQVLSALKIATPTSSSTKSITGYNVGIIPGKDSIDAGANPRTFYAKDPNTAKIPVGWVRNGDPKPVYGPATSSKTSGGMTRAQWDKAVGIYQRYNGVSRAEAMKAVQDLTPRPKK